MASQPYTLPTLNLKKLGVRVNKDLIFVIVSLIIILSITITLLYQFQKNQCMQEKGVFIRQNLPSDYGPEVTIEERQSDTARINDFYYGCLYPWK